MILMVKKQKQVDNGKCGSTELITEFYESENFVIKQGEVFDNKNNSITITPYDLKDEITNNFIHYEILEAYLMNKDGKTIEKIR